jgi:hypothetical protein
VKQRSGILVSLTKANAKTKYAFKQMKSEYVELQRFNQWWLWVFILALNLLPVYGIYKQMLMGEPWGNNPMSDVGLFIFLGFTLSFALFFSYIELRTEIDSRGIRVRLRPISTQSFHWEQIESVQLVRYGFVGYGLRLMTKFGTVYNTRGRYGLAIATRDGGRYLIGTQEPRKLAEVVRRLRPVLLTPDLYPNNSIEGV